MFRQHAAGEFLDLAERDGLETASAFQPKREAADTAEKIEDAKGHHSPLPTSAQPQADDHADRDAEEGPEGEDGHASTIAAAGRVISGAGL